ncbi:MAG: DUF2808 domain-containing protein, partial [Hormoscilla sp. SP12CHS1]|nr:DUF2808 domain-containing protein [Hormoscilla sp. SP12CHS1]
MKNYKLLSQLGIAIAVPAVIGAVAVLPVSGVTLRDGKVYFVQLVRAATTNNGARMRGATYYFTISLPENADEPLQRVTIYQRLGWEFPRFYLEESRGARTLETLVTQGLLPQSHAINFVLLL